MYFLNSYSANTNSVRNLLNTSKGRDKFSQLIQYVSNFYITCMKESEVYGDLVKQKKEPTVLRAKSLEGNISNGRKIFRLFLWLNEITLLEEIITNKKMPFEVKLMKIVSTICSFFYYLTDNIVWMSQIGYASPKVFGYRWKKIKDAFSLAKTILEVTISSYAVILNKRKERKLRKEIYAHAGKLVEPHTEQYVLIRNLIIFRRDAVFAKVEMIIYLARALLLTKGLRLPGHDYLQPIFISLCGLFQASCAVFKSMKGKKPFKVLTIEDVKKSKKIKDEGQKQTRTFVLPFDSSPKENNASKPKGLGEDLDQLLNQNVKERTRTRRHSLEVGNSAAAVRLITSLRDKLQDDKAAGPKPDSPFNKEEKHVLKQTMARESPPIIDDIYDSNILTQQDHILSSISTNINYFTLMTEF